MSNQRSVTTFGCDKWVQFWPNQNCTTIYCVCATFRSLAFQVLKALGHGAKSSRHRVLFVVVCGPNWPTPMGLNHARFRSSLLDVLLEFPFLCGSFLDLFLVPVNHFFQPFWGLFHVNLEGEKDQIFSSCSHVAHGWKRRSFSRGQHL